MASTAIVLVHDLGATQDSRSIGNMATALEGAGLTVALRSFTETTPELPEPTELDVLVVMGSKEAAYDDSVPWLAAELDYLRRVVAAGVRTVGVCFGSQALARVLGGAIYPASEFEFGFIELTSAEQDLVSAGPWMSFHGDKFDLPPSARLLGHTAIGPQAFVKARSLGVQFHPEINPAMFDWWRESWGSNDTLGEAVVRLGFDLDRLEDDVLLHADSTKAACKQLVMSLLRL